MSETECWVVKIPKPKVPQGWRYVETDDFFLTWNPQANITTLISKMLDTLVKEKQK